MENMKTARRLIDRLCDRVTDSGVLNLCRLSSPDTYGVITILLIMPPSDIFVVF